LVIIAQHRVKNKNKNVKKLEKTAVFFQDSIVLGQDCEVKSETKKKNHPGELLFKVKAKS